MSFLTIDQKRCKRDGICVESCPLGLIRQKDPAAFPSAVFHAEKFCLECGHCVSVCPHGALSTKTISPDQCTPVREDLLLTPEQAEHFLRSRRSIRAYKETMVDRGVLKKLVEIARYAPSGHNGQPVEWMILYNPEDVHKLAGFVVDWMRFCVTDQPAIASALHLDKVIQRWESGQDPVCRQAPHMILAHVSKANAPALAASHLALAYLELAAPAFGLGACWAGYFGIAAQTWAPILQALDLPDGHICPGAMMIGYPKYSYRLLPPRKEPKIIWR